MNIINYMPELNYHFNRYWKSNAELVFSEFPLSEEETDDEFYPPGSIFELLFNNTFNDSSSGTFNYLFKSIQLNRCHPSTVRRFKTMGKTINCYVSDVSGSIDLFSVDTNDNLSILLDKLYDYRMDGAADISSIDIEDLDDNILAKLIFIYLNFVINGIYQPFDSEDSISTESSILENLFELYVVNEAHKIIQTYKEFLENDILQLRPSRKKYTVDDELLESGEIVVTSELPYDSDSIFLYRNGNLIENDMFTVNSDSSSLTISGLDSTGAYGINLKEDDVLILDYLITI